MWQLGDGSRSRLRRLSHALAEPDWQLSALEWECCHRNVKSVSIRRRSEGTDSSAPKKTRALGPSVTACLSCLDCLVLAGGFIRTPLLAAHRRKELWGGDR